MLGGGEEGGGTHPSPGHPPPLGGRRGGAARLSLTGPLRTTCVGGGSAIGPRHVSRNPGLRRHRRGPVKTGGQQAGPRVAGRGGGGSAGRAAAAGPGAARAGGREAPPPPRTPPSLPRIPGPPPRPSFPPPRTLGGPRMCGSGARRGRSPAGSAGCGDPSSFSSFYPHPDGGRNFFLKYL